MEILVNCEEITTSYRIVIRSLDAGCKMQLSFLHVVNIILT